MAEEYIIIGAKDGKRAEEARDIESLIITYKDGRKEEIYYHPTSANPGQELMQYVDSNYKDAKAVITGQMVGPPKYNKRAIIQENEENIDRIVDKYNKGEYDPEIEKYPLEEIAEEAPAGEPKKTGEGKGERAQKGRGGCPPEEQEEYSRGSGTREGRAKEGKPKGTAYESESSESESEESGGEGGESGESSGGED